MHLYCQVPLAAIMFYFPNKPRNGERLGSTLSGAVATQTRNTAHEVPNQTKPNQTKRFLAIVGAACFSISGAAMLTATNVASAAPRAEPRHQLLKPLGSIDIPEDLPGTLIEIAPSESTGVGETDGASQEIGIEPDDIESYKKETGDWSVGPTNEVDPSDEQLAAVFEELVIVDDDTHRRFRYIVNRLKLRTATQRIAQHETPGHSTPLDAREREREDELEESTSSSNDSRVRRGWADGYGLNSYAMMGDWSGCSATIFQASSSRVWVLTAAHCLFTNDQGSATSADLVPRRDATLSAGDAPYGRWARGTYIYEPKYLSENCESDYDAECTQWDIALVRFTPISGTGASMPKSMGWAYKSGSYLSGRSKYRRGYPGCGTGAPSGCTSNVLYGDGSLSHGEFLFQNPDGWNRVIKHGSDTNSGDSGSGMYYYKNGSTTRLYGVHIAGDDSCVSCPSSNPNFMRRLTEFWYDTMVNTTW
ncbi:MAG: hypothetical protein V3W44_09115 [Dehalococcoidales bacterium]